MSASIAIEIEAGSQVVRARGPQGYWSGNQSWRGDAYRVQTAPPTGAGHLAASTASPTLKEGTTPC